MGLKSCAFVVAVIGGSLVSGTVLLWGASGLAAAFLLSLLGIPLLCFLLRALLPSKQQGVVGFFHPYADGGGGGERVLWCAIRAIEESFPDWQVVIYTGDSISSEELAGNAAARFGIHLKKSFKVVHLEGRSLVEANTYPKFTLVGQAFGSIVLAWEALSQLRPQVFVDTAGYAFTFPLALAAGSQVACYVHYPTISTDMLKRVQSRQATYNNSSAVASSAWLSAIKLGYYHAFALMYGAAGSCPSVVMVNSSWTEGHIRSLWWRVKPPSKVFPPCDTDALEALPLEGSRKPQIISVAQFRPEKAHLLQLEAFARAKARPYIGGNCYGNAEAIQEAKMVIVGGCRHKEDEERLEALRESAAAMGVSRHVEFHVNLPHPQLVELLGTSCGGLHTMVDEHFGISVVEYMAAGAIPIANNSGGPSTDIVVPLISKDGTQVQKTGFLSSTVDEYDEAITKVLTMAPEDRVAMASAGRQLCARFSEQAFARAFNEAMKPLLEKGR